MAEPSEVEGMARTGGESEVISIPGALPAPRGVVPSDTGWRCHWRGARSLSFNNNTEKISFKNSRASFTRPSTLRT